MESRIICAGLIIENNQIILVKESKKEIKGLWSLPAGRLELTDDSVEDCVIREVREEAGIYAQPLGILGVYIHYTKNRKDVIIVYVMDYIEGKVQASFSDVLEAKWVDLDSIDKYDLRSDYVKKAIKDSEERDLLRCSAIESVIDNNR